MAAPFLTARKNLFQTDDCSYLGKRSGTPAKLIMSVHRWG